MESASLPMAVFLLLAISRRTMMFSVLPRPKSADPLSPFRFWTMLKPRSHAPRGNEVLLIAGLFMVVGVTGFGCGRTPENPVAAGETKQDTEKGDKREAPAPAAPEDDRAEMPEKAE